MANLGTLVTVAGIGCVGALGWHYVDEMQQLYQSDVARPIRDTPFPLIGVSTGTVAAFATAKEEIRNRGGLKYIVGGLTAAMVPNVITSAWRWTEDTHQYLTERLAGQAPHMQFLEDMAGAGASLLLLYGGLAVIMNLCEGVAVGYRKLFPRRTLPPATPVVVQPQVQEP